MNHEQSEKKDETGRGSDASDSGDHPPRPDSLGPDEARAWAATLQTMLAVSSRLESDLHRAGGLTPFEFHLLVVLNRAGTEQPMSRVAFLADSSLSRLSHVVRRLEGRGWVARRTSEDDARVSLVALTGEGRDKLRAAFPAYVGLTRAILLDRLGPEDLAEYTRLNLEVLGQLRPDHWLFEEETVMELVGRRPADATDPTS